MRQTQNTQKNSNKKSVFVIALLLLLVAVIGFGGYTMSKYVSNKNGKGNASVAKWGFTVTANGDGLFGKEYKYDAGKNASVIKDDTSATLTVQAATGNTSNLVAPGTAGSMTFEVNGSAEVLAQIKVEMNIVSDVKLAYKKGETTQTPYTPVKWTLKKGDNVFTYTGDDGEVKLENVTLEDIKTGLTKLYSAPIAAGTSVSDKYTLSWAWAFETGSNDNEKALNNKLDTFLGMISNNSTVSNYNDGTDTYTKETGTSTTINFDLSVSVTQLKGNE